MTLLDLPHVLLHSVAGFLCTREYFNFALASRDCYAAASGVPQSQGCMPFIQYKGRPSGPRSIWFRQSPAANVLRGSSAASRAIASDVSSLIRVCAIFDYASASVWNVNLSMLW